MSGYLKEPSVEGQLIKSQQEEVGLDSGIILASHLFLWTLDVYLQNDGFNKMIPRVSPAVS